MGQPLSSGFKNGASRFISVSSEFAEVCEKFAELARSGTIMNFCSSAADPASANFGTFARLARDPRGYGGRVQATA